MKLQKGSEPLGISIVSGEKGGVYVSKVTGGSIAHQAGLEYGDQLLEVSESCPSHCLLLSVLSSLPGKSCASPVPSPHRVTERALDVP